MLNLKDSLEQVKNSPQFKNWLKENPKSHLCNFFKIADPKNLDEANWQIDFYNPEKDRITSFMAEEDRISILESDSKIFKKKKTKVEELKLENVKINLNKALNIINKLKNKKYSNENINKIIIILQKIKIPIWSITYLTTSFNILNVRIDAESGKIIKENLEPVLKFKTE